MLDLRLRLLSCLLLPLAFVSVETQCPAQEPPAIFDWGKFEDPSHNASIELGEQSAVITSFQNTPTVDDILGKMPRISRRVEGDFDARIQVSGDFVGEYQSAVFLALGDQAHCLQISSGSGRYKVDEISSFFIIDGTLIGSRHFRAKSTSVWLRIQRKNGELKSFFSYDGQSWISAFSTSSRTTRNRAVPFHQPMQLILAVHNRSAAPLDVTFTDFVVDESVVEDIETIEDPIETSQRKRARTRGSQLIFVACSIASAFALVFIWVYRRSQPFKQLALVALWTIPIWAVTSAFGWYGLQHSSFSMDPGSTLHPFVLLVIPVVITLFTVGSMLIGFMVQYVACMPLGWCARFCYHRIRKPTQHQMPDLKDETDSVG